MTPFLPASTPLQVGRICYNILLLIPKPAQSIYLKYTSISMSVAKEFELANANYVASFTKGDLQLPPQRCVNGAFLIQCLMQKASLTLFI